MGITPVLGLKESFIEEEISCKMLLKFTITAKMGLIYFLYPVKAEEVKR